MVFSGCMLGSVFFTQLETKMKSASDVNSLSSVHPMAVFCFVSFNSKGVLFIHISLYLNSSGRTHQKLVLVVATGLTVEQGKEKSFLESNF